MSAMWQAVIERTHLSPRRFVLAFVGGGGQAMADLLSVPGASESLLEARVPYSESALAEWLGSPPERACSRETALAMAVVAYQRARELAAQEHDLPFDEQFLVGIGGTAAISNVRRQRGDHRCFVAVQTATSTRLYSLVLQKGVRDRAGEERLVSHLLLLAMADACEIKNTPDIELTGEEAISEEKAQARSSLADVWAGRTSAVWSLPDGSLQVEIRRQPLGILSGSFAPLHEGHIALRAAAEEHLNGPVYYELAIENADKHPLDYLTIERRREQFGDRPLALTHAATFVDKARFLPNTTFVVGADTAERIVLPRYYHGSEELMRRRLSDFRRLGCRFLVAGRKNRDRFCTLSDIDLPVGFEDLFEELTETAFRSDLSSSDLRRRSLA